MSRNRLERYLPGNKRVRMLVLMAVDIGMVCLASFLGLFIRFDMNLERIPEEYMQAVFAYLPFYVIATIAVFFFIADVRHNVERGRCSGSRAYCGSLRAGISASDCRDADAGDEGSAKLFFAFFYDLVCR